MGVSPVLFQSAGQVSQHYIPGVYTRIDFAPSLTGNASVNNGVIIGNATGGKPGTLYVFSRYAQAKATLKSGPLLDALWHAFNPGDSYIPQQVGAVRVNSAVQAQVVLGVLTILSADYGLATNRIQLQVSNGTTQGKKIQVQQDTNLFTQDNVTLPAFSIQYVGTGTACTLAISNGQLVVTATGDAANSFSLDIVNTYQLVSDLAAFFATKPAFVFNVLGGAGVEQAQNLDTVAALDIKTAVATFRADLLAQTRALQACPLIGTITVGATRTPLANTTGWVNMTGGTEGTYTATDFSNALNYLLTQDVQFLGTSSEDAAIHALILSHVNQANSVNGKAERQFIVGGALGETVSQATARAAAINSPYGAVCYPGFNAFNDAGSSQLWSPAYYAAKEVGRQVALAVNEPATRKQVAILGWEWNLQIPDQENCIANGVWCGAKTKDGRFVNVRSVTTYQSNDLQQNEFSMMREALFVVSDLRLALDNAVIGRPMTAGILSLIDSTVAAKLNSYVTLGIFQQTQTSRGYWGYQRTINGSVVSVSFQCYLTPPTNFAFVTANMQVYSDMAAAA